MNRTSLPVDVFFIFASNIILRLLSQPWALPFKKKKNSYIVFSLSLSSVFWSHFYDNDLSTASTLSSYSQGKLCIILIKCKSSTLSLLISVIYLFCYTSLLVWFSLMELRIFIKMSLLPVIGKNLWHMLTNFFGHQVIGEFRMLSLFHPTHLHHTYQHTIHNWEKTFTRNLSGVSISFSVKWVKTGNIKWCRVAWLS